MKIEADLKKLGTHDGGPVSPGNSGYLILAATRTRRGITYARIQESTVPLKCKLPPSRETRLVSHETRLERNKTNFKSSYENCLQTRVFKDIVFWRWNERFMPNRTGDIFRVCRDASDNNKVHYATDSSSRAARQTFPWQKNLKLMQTGHLRNFD